ncbi:uncharacterized protein RJT20DRAFT_65320 [Scheffersomyces xylosifermentans]|uniref:uncharacterized protein n=1 Tax=Scheffersomyces xylosifermentans TaxID=1304137 RepID=UPI00315D966D
MSYISNNRNPGGYEPNGQHIHKNITTKNGEDRLPCTFYNKIGSCRHGEKCSRKHIRPTSSNTILLPNLYQNPKLNKNKDEELNAKQLQQYFDQFYKDIFVKFATLGAVTDIVVCENENNHLNGNVYVKFENKKSALYATHILNQEWFDARPVHCELSPVNSFEEANCRAYEVSECTRGDHCNFMHVHKPTQQLVDSLMSSQRKSILLHKLAELKEEESRKAETEKSEDKNENSNQSSGGSGVTTSMVEQLFA